MSTTISSSGGPGIAAPFGNHRAVCVGVIDLGTQSFTYNNEIQRHPKVMIQWELTDELMEDGRPFMVSEEFTSYLSEKANLRKFLDSWRGRPFTPEELKGFALEKLLGVPCLLNVIHGTSKKGKTFAQAKSASPLPKGMSKPEPINDLRHYQIEDGPPPDDMPDWIRRKINESDERRQATPTHHSEIPPSSGAPDDDIPF